MSIESVISFFKKNNTYFNGYEQALSKYMREKIYDKIHIIFYFITEYITLMILHFFL